MKGLVVQVALLAGLAATVGLGAAGWLAGLGYAVATCALLSRAVHTAGLDRLGPADRVTLARAVLVGGVTALAADSFQRPTPVPVLVGLTVVALALDWVDGQVARRTGTSSTLGARFDMEVDAYLLLVLSVYLVGPVGWWVLAVGGMRYAYVAASWTQPWMRFPLPARYWRKVVAATQGVVLLIAASAVLPPVVNLLAVAVSLGLLVESFTRDVTWQWRHRTLTVAPFVGGSRAPVRAGRSS